MIFLKNYKLLILISLFLLLSFLVVRNKTLTAKNKILQQDKVELQNNIVFLNENYQKAAAVSQQREQEIIFLRKTTTKKKIIIKRVKDATKCTDSAIPAGIFDQLQ